MAAKKKSHTALKVALVVVLLLGATTAVLASTKHWPFNKDTKAARVASSAKQHTSPSFTINKPSPSNNVPPSSDGQDKSTGTSTAVLKVPVGTFVSNHHPTLSGPTKDAPGPYMTSTCATTTGATCKITFTKDGVTESLAPETADSTGSTYWDWKLQDYGLTAGTWQITAVATLGSQTQTATDPQNLVVSP